MDIPTLILIEKGIPPTFSSPLLFDGLPVADGVSTKGLSKRHKQMMMAEIQYGYKFSDIGPYRGVPGEGTKQAFMQNELAGCMKDVYLTKDEIQLQITAGNPVISKIDIFNSFLEYSQFTVSYRKEEKHVVLLMILPYNSVIKIRFSEPCPFSAAWALHEVRMIESDGVQKFEMTIDPEFSVHASSKSTDLRYSGVPTNQRVVRKELIPTKKILPHLVFRNLKNMSTNFIPPSRAKRMASRIKLFIKVGNCPLQAT
ncbi:hypothetical protein PCE1_003855 [Barthelona sp. PCE]